MTSGQSPQWTHLSGNSSIWSFRRKVRANCADRGRTAGGPFEARRAEDRCRAFPRVDPMTPAGPSRIASETRDAGPEVGGGQSWTALRRVEIRTY